MTWHPRGEPTWPTWRSAPAGTRVRHVRSGWTGTLVSTASRHVTIEWDQSGARGRVVAPAYDLQPVDETFDLEPIR